MPKFVYNQGTVCLPLEYKDVTTTGDKRYSTGTCHFRTDDLGQLVVNRYIVQNMLHGRDQMHTGALASPDYDLLDTEDKGKIKELLLCEMKETESAQTYELPRNTPVLAHE